MRTEPHIDENTERVRHQAEIEEVIKRARQVQADAEELIETIRWQLFLGFDPVCIEFTKKLHPERHDQPPGDS